MMQEAYTFSVKPKGAAKDKWDFLKFGPAVPSANQPLELIAVKKENNTCKL
jgi:branched-chain amino acid transport system substrate-binding protein